MTTEPEEAPAPDAASPRSVAPPSAGRALLIVAAVLVASWLWVPLWEWWLHQVTAFWAENLHNQRLSDAIRTASSQGFRLMLVHNLLVSQWVTRPLWRMAAASRSVDQTLVLGLCMTEHLVSFALWLFSFLLVIYW